MGEARRRRLAVLTQHPMLPPPAPSAPEIKYTEYVLSVPKPLDEQIQSEMEKFNEGHDVKFHSRHDYAIALLQAAVNREERLRDEREARTRLIQPATPAALANLLGGRG